MSAFGGYSTTSYGAAGGDDGGGFMWGSQTGSQSAVKPVNDESLRPVTIKQMIDAEPVYAGDALFKIDGQDVKQVTFVGMVRSISQQTTNITYKLDDGTGVIEVKLWLDADKQESAEGAGPQFKEEDYVRVWGRLKSFSNSNKRHVGAHVIKPVRDFNEVNYHLLEATYVHLFFKRGAVPQPGGNENTTMGGTGAGGAAGGDSMFVDSGHDAKLRNYSAKAKKMYNCLNQANGISEGVNMHVIAREANMTIQDVMAAAEELLGYGSIYTTLDDETFAILEGY
ncbi:replication protein A, subunit RPA32 [Xylariaceae sp. FL1651]|nr:replication protein A, subunit RPA32 [Xylariaceae sp. FL1651]